jgi:hypothetical protein
MGNVADQGPGHRRARHQAGEAQTEGPEQRDVGDVDDRAHEGQPVEADPVPGDDHDGQAEGDTSSSLPSAR